MALINKLCPGALLVVFSVSVSGEMYGFTGSREFPAKTMGPGLHLRPVHC